MMRCEACDRAMRRDRLTGTEWVWNCQKCKGEVRTEATAEEIAAYKKKQQALWAKQKAQKREQRAKEQSEKNGEAPEGEDAELWAMRKVMSHGDDYELDVGPRQKFYRRIYDDDPLRFAKLMHDREDRVKAEVAPVEKDEGLDRSLEMAETLLGEVANSK